MFLILAGAAALYAGWQGRLERSQDKPIRAAARRYRVEPALVKAIVWRESRFNPAARGRVGELGLMQLHEDAAREWAHADRLPRLIHAPSPHPPTTPPPRPPHPNPTPP